MTRRIEVGSAVVFVDEDRVEHDALVTCMHGSTGVWDDEKPHIEGNYFPCINLVYVLKDEKYKDQYGQQLRRPSSVVHKAVNQAGGYMWKLKQ